MLHFSQMFRQLLCSTGRTICVNLSIFGRSTHRSQKREIATGRQSEYPRAHCSEHINLCISTCTIIKYPLRQSDADLLIMEQKLMQRLIPANESQVRLVAQQPGRAAAPVRRGGFIFRDLWAWLDNPQQGPPAALHPAEQLPMPLVW
jgi:hypothetical protein